MKHVVVIGAGQAGFSTCTELRKRGHDGPITLIGEEPAPPYQRPPLSKAYLLGEMARERLFLRPEAFYAEHDITLRTGCRIAEINRNDKVVRTAVGEEIAYDHLVLTTGSRPLRLPSAAGGELDGVLSMRDLADADALARRAQAGRKALVVGGGYIGLEAAAVLVKLGLSVTLLEAEDRILSRVASRVTSEHFRALHQAHGVILCEGTRLDHLRGEDGRVIGAVLSDGRHIPVDLVVTGIGIRPNTDLAQAAGLEVDNGIKVDEFCQTSESSILAAGDCASFPYRDARIRLESVGNAIDQAQIAAATILGQREPYAAKPWFWSDQFDTKLQIVGLSTGHDNVVHRTTDEAAKSLWYYRGDTLLAVDAINDPRGYMVAKRLIDAGKSPPKSRVADAGVAIKDLLRS